jgi:hypothetical protein
MGFPRPFCLMLTTRSRALGPLLRWRGWSRWSCCSRVTVARGPSLMTSGASRCPSIPPACSGGRSGAGGGRGGVRSGRGGGVLCFGL